MGVTCDRHNTAYDEIPGCLGCRLEDMLRELEKFTGCDRSLYIHDDGCDGFSHSACRRRFHQEKERLHAALAKLLATLRDDTTPTPLAKKP